MIEKKNEEENKINNKNEISIDNIDKLVSPILSNNNNDSKILENIKTNKPKKSGKKILKNKDRNIINKKSFWFV